MRFSSSTRWFTICSLWIVSLFVVSFYISTSLIVLRLFCLINLLAWLILLFARLLVVLFVFTLIVTWFIFTFIVCGINAFLRVITFWCAFTFSICIVCIAVSLSVVLLFLILVCRLVSVISSAVLC